MDSEKFFFFTQVTNCYWNETETSDFVTLNMNEFGFEQIVSTHTNQASEMEKTNWCETANELLQLLHSWRCIIIAGTTSTATRTWGNVQILAVGIGSWH